VKGRSLKLLLDARGWTQARLADELGRAQPEVSRWINGLRQIPESVHDDLTNALGVSADGIDLLDTALPPTASPVHYRKLKSVGSRRISHFDAFTTVLGVAVDQLLESLDFTVDHTIPDLVGMAADEAASHVRALWRLGNEPIPHLISVLEAAGVFVVGHDFGVRQVSGMSTVTPKGRVLMLYNRTSGWDRIRFTLAHELAHSIIHSDGILDEHVEVEADEFAAHLLMPADAFRGVVRRTGTDLTSFVSTKHYWRASVAAQVVHARRLDLVPESKYRTLNRQINGRGWRLAEPHPIAPEEPTLWRELLDAHGQVGADVDDLARLSSVLTPAQVAELAPHLTWSPITPKGDADVVALSHRR